MKIIKMSVEASKGHNGIVRSYVDLTDVEINPWTIDSIHGGNLIVAIILDWITQTKDLPPNI